MVDYVLLEQRLRAGAPLEAYGIHGYYTSGKHDLIISPHQCLSFTGLFDPTRGYNCGQVNALLCRLLQSHGRQPRFVAGQEKLGLFPHHYFCIDDTVLLDATPLFPFVNPDHIVSEEREAPTHFWPEINSPLGVYQEDEVYLLFLRSPRMLLLGSDYFLRYDFVVRSMDTPLWIKYTICVEMDAYRGTVMADSLPYTSLPVAADVMEFLERKKILKASLIGHEALQESGHQAAFRALQKIRPRYADAEMGLIHKAAAVGII